MVGDGGVGVAVRIRPVAVVAGERVREIEEEWSDVGGSEGGRMVGIGVGNC